MNLTITTRNKPNKQSFIQLVPPAPQTLPSKPEPSAPPPSNRSRQEQCGSNLFGNCLYVHPSELNEQYQISNDLQLYKLTKPTPRSPKKNDSDKKCKISVSLNQKNSQQILVPKQRESIKWPTSLQASPILLKPESEETSIVKFHLTSTSASQIKNGKNLELDLRQNNLLFMRPSVQPFRISMKQESPKQTVSFATPEYEDHWQEPERSSLFHQMPPQFTFNDGSICIQHEQCSFAAEKEAPKRQLESPAHEEEIPEVNFKERLRDRRWIGEYAKTIKTINHSDPRENQSQIESIVIQRGSQRFNQNMAVLTHLNRGSIREYQNEQETLRRAYGSVGEGLHKAHQDPHFGNIDQAIEEVLYDSQI